MESSGKFAFLAGLKGYNPDFKEMDHSSLARLVGQRDFSSEKIKTLEKRLAHSPGRKRKALEMEIGRYKILYDEAVDCLLNGNMNLLYHLILNEGEKYWMVEPEELFSAGQQALYKSAQGWNLEGAKFGSYAGVAIKRAFNAVSIKAQRQCRDKRKTVSIDDPIYPGEDHKLRDICESSLLNPRELLENEELSRDLQKGLKMLSEKEKYVVDRYFGFDGSNSRGTYHTIGRELNLSHTSIGNTLNNSLLKLKRYLQYKSHIE